MVKIKRHLTIITILMILFICSTVAYFFYDKILYPRDGIFDKPMEINITMKYILDPVNGLKLTTFRDLEITAYNSLPCQTDNTPNITATGRMTSEGIVAISQDYFRKTIFPGDLVYIKKLKKWFIADDCKNARLSHSFDIFMFSNIQAKKFGKIKSDVYVIRLEK